MQRVRHRILKWTWILAMTAGVLVAPLSWAQAWAGGRGGGGHGGGWGAQGHATHGGNYGHHGGYYYGGYNWGSYPYWGPVYDGNYWTGGINPYFGYYGPVWAMPSHGHSTADDIMNLINSFP